MVSQSRAAARWVDRYGPMALVTGASDGIGEAFAHALAARGVGLVLTARRQDRLHNVGEQLKSRFGVPVESHAVDLADRDAVDRLLSATSGHDIGLLVACAGFGTSGALVDADPAIELSMLDVNCRAVLALTTGLAPRLVQRGRGGIILMSSIVAFQGVPRAANYAATKAYIQCLAEGLRVELAPKGVDVLASAPGPVDSGFAARADMRMGQAERPATVAVGSLAALGRRTTAHPGRLSKLLGWSLATLPRPGRTTVMRAVMGGMTRHQGS